MSKITYSFVAFLLSSSLLANDCCRTECKPKNSCDCEITSRSYLSVRSHFKPASPEMISGFRTDRSHAREEGRHGAIQAVIYGSKSTDDRSLARYFFPFCKTSLIVEEFDNRTDGNNPAPQLPTSSKPINILAEHFNIFTTDENFKSEISIRPRQNVVGAGAQLRKSFAFNEEENRNFFISGSFPVERVKNNLHFDETIIRDGGGLRLAGGEPRNYGTGVANMREAFQQEGWNFGKIDMNGRSQTGVADIEAHIGYEWIREEQFHLESYLGLVIPTGNKPNAQYLFEPIVGNGHHWGITLGGSVGIEIWHASTYDHSLHFACTGHSQYLFKNTQCRSIDLVCKPWSRYMELYRNQEEAEAAHILSIDVPSDIIFNNQVDLTSFGINVLTMPVNVHPGFSHNVTIASLFNRKGWQFEGGYNYYSRESECVELSCPWQEGPAIKSLNGSGLTNPIRDITGNARIERIPPIIFDDSGDEDFNNRLAFLDYKYNVIKEKELDLVSASSPSLITHTVYLATSYRFDERERPGFLNAGGSYEFNHHNNAALNRWTIWAKGGLSF